MINKLNTLHLTPYSDAGTEVDPFAVETGSVDISFPIIIAGNVHAEIKSAEVVDGKKVEGSKNIKVTYVTTQDTTSTKGDVIPAGSVTFFQHICITVTDKLTLDMIKKAVTRLAKAAGLPATTTIRSIMDDPSQLNGKPVVIKVKVAKETTDFPERNEVAGLVIEG